MRRQELNVVRHSKTQVSKLLSRITSIRNVRLSILVLSESCHNDRAKVIIKSIVLTVDDNDSISRIHLSITLSLCMTIMTSFYKNKPLWALERRSTLLHCSKTRTALRSYMCSVSLSSLFHKWLEPYLRMELAEGKSFRSLHIWCAFHEVTDSNDRK